MTLDLWFPSCNQPVGQFSGGPTELVGDDDEKDCRQHQVESPVSCAL